MRRFLIKCGIFACPLIAVFTPAIIHLETHHELVPIEAMAERNQDEGALIGLAYSDPMHLVKQAVLKQRQPQIIALGTSRVLPFRGISFKDPETFYNCGRSIGKILDLDSFLMAYPGKMPKVIILGLDQDFFIWDEEDYDKKPRAYQHKSTTYGSRMNKGTKAFFEAWSDGEIITGKPTHQTIRFIGRNARLYQEGYRTDGSYCYGRLLQSEEKADEYEFVSTLRRIGKGKGRFATADKVSPEAVQMLGEFLKKCRDMKIHVVGFLPPYAGKVYDRLKEAPEDYPHVFNLESQLQVAFQTEKFQLIDYSDIRNLGSNDFETTDGFHASEVCYLKLLMQLSQKDQKLQEYVDLIQLNQQIKNTYSARQIIEEVTEQSPRSPIR